jgi:isopentenyldiphosphate isomerase
MGSEQELIYQVDENDQIVGPCLRGDAHRLGLRHRSVHILVFNPEGELFLQKRSNTKDINPGLWDTSAAGHVDFGESYDDSARRELAEELGINSDAPLNPLFKLEASAETGWEFVQVYQLTHAGELRLEPGEITEGRWFDLSELENWIAKGGNGLTHSFQILWARFCGM